MCTCHRLRRQNTPVDLVISGFTLMGSAMIVSEFCEVAMSGFILQPTCIPSKDAEWKCVLPTEHHSTLLDGLSGVFTSQEALQNMKLMAEINVPKMRSQFGLHGNVLTWPELLRSFLCTLTSSSEFIPP